MTRYLNYAFVFDLTLTGILGFLLYKYGGFFADFFILPSAQIIRDFAGILIGIAATLVGFLLTIITLVVTFKNSYESENKKSTEEEKNYSELPKTNVFDKRITRKEQFYGSNISKYVVKVFLYATYEIAFVAFVLLLFQLNILKLTAHNNLIIVVMGLFMISMSVFRSLLIFHLFIRVHLPDKTDKPKDVD